MSPTAVGAVMALVATASAPASFLLADASFSQIGGVYVLNVQARFTDPNDTLLSIFSVTSVSAPLHHSDLVGGTFAPQFTLDEATDTYVTIGGPLGFNNTTAADLGWGAAGFALPSMPAGAGWYNSNPTNLQGRVDPDTLRVTIGQFARDGSLPFFSLSGSMAYNQGPGTTTQFAQWTIFPAPAATLLLLGVPIIRRRERGFSPRP